MEQVQLKFNSSIFKQILIKDMLARGIPIALLFQVLSHFMYHRGLLDGIGISLIVFMLASGLSGFFKWKMKVNKVKAQRK
ncbi:MULTISPECIES: hypothetical protein [Vibrio]|uniref:Uncharacterized protein n=2 Tax=Vibrio TaxID=662 RepID=A0A7X4LJL1_9VIBR|nr:MULTISPECIES: hypothetical protein [Vibrio]MBF9002820.1 hypothetical protein [Vibrio nitrifigilis]MZI92960.1 hypothetical protein [Vibrio eleionomae]